MYLNNYRELHKKNHLNTCINLTLGIINSCKNLHFFSLLKICVVIFFFFCSLKEIHNFVCLCDVSIYRVLPANLLDLVGIHLVCLS